jgi:hypothetical protein
MGKHTGMAGGYLIEQEIQQLSFTINVGDA